MSRRKLGQMLQDGSFLLGTWSQSASPEMLEIIGYSGFDFTIIDTEHGAFGLETAENLVRAADAAGIASLVRVTNNENHLITKALDIGAHGVVVPQITSVNEASEAVSAARYYPEGNRGACPCVRAGQHYVTNWTAHAKQANADVVIVLLVEGREGMENLESIVQTPGVNAVMIGPFDLSVSLGVGGQLDHHLVTDFMKRAITLCEQFNVHLLIPNFDLDIGKARSAIDAWQKLGAKNFTVGTDKLFFAHHMKNINSEIRGD